MSSMPDLGASASAAEPAFIGLILGL